MAIVTTNVQPWIYVPDPDAVGWQPHQERVLQLYGNTQITGYRYHPSIGQYPVINGFWACQRSTGPYRGCFPGGLMERVETALKVFNLIPNFDPGETKMFFPFGGSVIQRPNIHTLDINPSLDATYIGDATDPVTVSKVPDDYYDVMVVDPPYETVDWEGVIRLARFLKPNISDREMTSYLESLSKMFRVKTYSERLYQTKAIGPYSFLSKNPNRVNLAKKVRIGGVILILHQLVYMTIPSGVRSGVIAITTGPNMRMRAFSVFIRVDEGTEKDFEAGKSKLSLKTLEEVFGDGLNGFKDEVCDYD